MQSQNLSQRLAVLGAIPPAAARAAGSYFTDPFDAMNIERVLAKLHMGTLLGSATINARFQHSLVSGTVASDWSDVNSETCITSTFGSADGNNGIAQLELRTDQNPDTKRYLRLFVLVATSTWIGSAEVEGQPAIYQPASDFNIDNVVQTVVY